MRAPTAVGARRGTRVDGIRGEMMRYSDYNFNETLPTNLTRFNDSIYNSIASVLNIYYTPLLVFFGVLGNLLSVYVFYSTKHRLQSTSLYLSALALSDTLFLMQLLPPWLNALDIAPLFHQQGWCQMVVYISYVSSCLSAWLVVAFTVERFVAVLYPLRRNVLCTVSRARIIIVALTLLALVLNLPVLRFATTTEYDCNINLQYLQEAARFNMVDTAVSFTIPLAVIMVLNAWIGFSVCRFERARLALSKQQRARGASPSPPGRRRAAAPHRVRLQRPPGPPRSQRRVTRMLLMISSAFVLLNLPAYTMRILAYSFDIDRDEIAERWDALQQVALTLFNTNFGVNFVLYCLSGQSFRRSLAEALPWRRRRARRAALQRHVFSRPARTNSISASVSNGTNSVQFNTTDAGSTPDFRSRRRITHWTADDNTRRRNETAAAVVAGAGAAAREQPREAIEMVVIHSA